MTGQLRFSIAIKQILLNLTSPSTSFNEFVQTLARTNSSYCHAFSIPKAGEPRKSRLSLGLDQGRASICVVEQDVVEVHT